MKIALIVISNRPNNLKRFIDSLAVVSEIRELFTICCLLQNPFTGNETFLSGIDRFNIIESKGEPVPFTLYRKMAMQMMPDADWFWSLDDDHQFANGNGDMFNKSCSDYYSEVFQYINGNNYVGAVNCKGYVGGYSSGYDFIVNPSNGLVATDKGGIFLRNIGIDEIIDSSEENLVGALFESLAIYNIMHRGYDLVRRFNSPMTNKNPGSAKHIGGSGVISYSDEVVNSNIQGHIRKKFNDPTWTHSSKKYPKLISERIGR